MPTLETNSRGWATRHRRSLMLFGPLVVLVVGGYFYVTGGRYVSTDDAYIQSARVSVSADVAGRVVEVKVEDNQSVKKGDLLFRLDPQPFEIAVQEAEAKLSSARLQVEATKATYRQKQADLTSAQETLSYQQRETARQKKLAKEGISSQAQLDQANHAFNNAQQDLAARRQEAETVLANLGGNLEIAPEQHPAVQQAQAALDRAKLNLSYTSVTAPIDGTVTKVESLQVGDYVNAATPVFALVSNTDIWVEANYKETELTHMRPGQKASISVDAYPGRNFTGRVASTSPGTGSSFSLLPPENATGNWVKIVQRLPVRIALDKSEGNTPLHAGLSVTATVDTEHSRFGHGR